MHALKAHAWTPSDSDLQRFDGVGRMVLSGSAQGTRIVDVLQRSPVRIMFPVFDGRGVEEAVLVNTAGGVAGADRLEFDVTTLPGAALAVTSQAAEKIYRALGEPAHISTRLRACEDSCLAWLPQETIVFNLARFRRETDVDVCSGAQLLALEWLVLGRTAHGERLVGGHISDRWRVHQNGRLIWADDLRATDETFAHLHRSALLSSCKAVATLIYFGPRPGTRLEFLRDVARAPGCHFAATAIGGLIVARFAASTGYELKVALRGVLQQFGPELRDAPFRVPRMWSC